MDKDKLFIKPKDSATIDLFKTLGVPNSILYTKNYNIYDHFKEFKIGNAFIKKSSMLETLKDTGRVTIINSNKTTMLAQHCGFMLFYRYYLQVKNHTYGYYPKWYYLNGSFNDPLLRKNMGELIVLDSIYHNSTDSRVEKLRDIINYQRGKIIILSCSDNLESLLHDKLNITIDGAINLGSRSNQYV